MCASAAGLILLGSLVSSAGATASTQGVATQVPAPTFNRDIAPLLWERCGACHRPGASGPFSLLEYSDVVPRARQIAAAVQAGTMPPWLPEPGAGFANERRLATAEIDLIGQWVRQGTKQGDPADLPPRPKWTDGWQLGTPDLVVSLPAPYLLARGETDTFRAFVLAVPLTSSRYVRGVEIRPGNPHVVHHASMAVDRTRGSRDLDAADPAPGFAGGMISEGARSPESRAIGWTPGMTAAFEPEGMAWRLDPGSDLVVQLHMLPTRAGVSESVRPSVGLYFTDRRPTRLPMDFKLGSKVIAIPAGAANYVVEDSVRLPVAVDLLSVYPHAHYLAREMTATATFPTGGVQRLITIREWDFHWQDEYRYKSPISLPAGTRVTMRFVYDNSAGNQHVVGRRPVPVQYGPRSSDEMGDLWLRLVPHTPDDYLALARSYRSREIGKDVEAGEALVARRATDASARHALGVAYLAAGRLPDAVVQLNDALRLDPGHVEAHNNLGHALQLQARPAEALVQFRQAARLAPGNDVVRLNVANALLDVGEVAEAISEYRASLALNPVSADAHNGLGTALAALGRFADAEQEFLEALKLRPDHADAQRNLDQVVSIR